MTEKKSCTTCPSLLTSRESTLFFGKSIGVPTCARFGKPMGTMNDKPRDVERIATVIGSACASHGEDRPLTVDWRVADFQVMLPDPATIGKTPVNQELCRTCLTCSNFVTSDAVVKEIGWNAGLCAAKGILVLGSRLTLEARNCEYRSFGSTRSDTGGLTFIPEYAEVMNSNSADPIAAHAKAKLNFVDPVEYVSDLPVSEEDAKRGIRAWRNVTDPQSGNSVHLPIYDIEKFSDDERAKIPRTGDDEHPEDYIDHFFGVYKCAALWTQLDETPALWGQSGGGKTELYRHLAWLMCLPFERLSITGSTELDDLAGKWLFEGNTTVFEFGRLPRAWSKPCIICIDEPNTGPNEVWQFIRPLTDNSKQLVLDMAKGQRIDRHLDAYLGMAMNPAWDYRNVGANQIGDADANRLMHMAVGLPPDKLEREIIAKRIEHDGWEITAEQMNMVMQIASDIRNLIEADGLTMSWAIRPQIKVARALRWFDPITAYRMAAADFLEPQQAEQVLDIVRASVD